MILHLKVQTWTITFVYSDLFSKPCVKQDWSLNVRNVFSFNPLSSTSDTSSAAMAFDLTLSKSFLTMELHYFTRIRRILQSTRIPAYPISTVSPCNERRGWMLCTSLQTCSSGEFRSNLVQYSSHLSKQIRYRMRSLFLPSTLSYSTPLYDRTHTFKTPLRSYNTNNIGSYSPLDSEASLKFSTSFSSQSRQNSSR